MQKVYFRVTEDGSHTLFVPDLNEHYHSIHGAIRESGHIYIQAGLLPLAAGEPSLSILEIGFGTGLNAFLTLIEAKKLKLDVHYTTIDPMPLAEEIWSALNYPRLIGNKKANEWFWQIHQAPWEVWIDISPKFHLRKVKVALENFEMPGHLFHLVFFDAFAPDVQPELWTEEIFDKIFRMMAPGGKLVTYCCKGYVRRNMLNAGFGIEKLPGPQGKREMLRATKPMKS